MIITELKTNRFTFDNWVKDSRGYWNSISKIVIAGKYPTQVLLTIEEPDSDKVNANTQLFCDAILQDLESVDNEGDDFRTEMFLESSGGNTLPFTLMFFKYTP